MVSPSIGRQHATALRSLMESPELGADGCDVTGLSARNIELTIVDLCASITLKKKELHKPILGMKLPMTMLLT